MLGTFMEIKEFISSFWVKHIVTGPKAVAVKKRHTAARKPIWRNVNILWATTMVSNVRPNLSFLVNQYFEWWLWATMWVFLSILPIEFWQNNGFEFSIRTCVSHIRSECKLFLANQSSMEGTIEWNIVIFHWWNVVILWRFALQKLKSQAQAIMNIKYCTINSFKSGDSILKWSQQ